MCAPRRPPRRFSSNTAATFPISSSAMNTRSRCPGWRTWRGSSARGSMPIMPPMRNRSRRRPWLPSRPEQLAATILKPHPATRIVRSRFPAVTIFSANRSDGPVGRIEASEPEDALVTRPGSGGHRPARSPGRRGFPDSAHCRRATRRCRGGSARRVIPSFDLAANIAGMIEAGVFAGVHPEG